jgi:hypothetical protein
MSDTRSIDLRLVGGLACLALLYPILRVTANLLGGDGDDPIGGLNAWLWLIVGAAWVVIVWLLRAPRPLATLVLTGLTGGVLTVLVVIAVQLGAAGSADLLNEPMGIVALVALNTLGGFICGLIAWGLQSLKEEPQR